MLGDCVNSFNQTDLSRFYLSSMAGYFPLEQNAFDVERKRCQTRKLRTVQAANTLLFVCVSDYDITDYVEKVETNVIDMFAKKQSRQSSREAATPIRRNLKWKALYLSDREIA